MQRSLPLHNPRSKTGYVDMRLSFKLLLLPPFLLLFFNATSQKNVDESEETWFGYFNQMRFTHRSGLWLDGHLRLTDHYIRRKALGIIRGAYVRSEERRVGEEGEWRWSRGRREE